MSARRPVPVAPWRAAIAAWIGLALLPGMAVQPVIPAPITDQTITAKRLPLPELALPAGVRLAEFWQLQSRFTGFGGWSALALTGPRTFLLVSDTGRAARFEIRANGIVTGARQWSIGGITLDDKTLTDFESLAMSPDRQTAWIGAEHANAITKLRSETMRRSALAYPLLMQDWRPNGGAETLVRLQDGSFVAISETTNRSGFGREAVLFEGDPTQTSKAFRFFYDPGDLGHPVDAAELPDGRLLILHRRIGWSGFSSALAIADLRQARPGSRVRPQVLLTLAGPEIQENYEGIAIADAGDTLDVWLLSDDNLMRFERTLLLRLSLPKSALNRSVQ